MRRILMLMISVMLIVALAVSASAATQTEDGIEVELVTEKTEYARGEKITATVTVTNTNDYDATNVSLDCVVPEGYKVSRGSTLTIPTVAAGETQTLQVTFVPAVNVLWIILAVVLIMVAAIACVFLFRRKPKQITAAVLCMAMLLSMASTTVLAVDNDMALPDDNFTGDPNEEETIAPTEETTTPTEDTTEPSEDPDAPGDINISDDFSAFAPVVSTKTPTENTWWITGTEQATLQDGAVKAKNLRYFVFDGITEDYTVEFKYQLPSGSQATVKMGESVESTTLQVWLTLRGGDSTNGDRANVSGVGNIIYGGEGEWHSVQVVVNNTNKTFKLYVDGHQRAVGTTKEFGFYKDITTLKRITFDCTSGDLLLDDFKLYLGAPESDKDDGQGNDFSDDFTSFNPVVGSSIPVESAWWITDKSKATLTEDNKLQVKNLRYALPDGVTEDYTVEFKYRLPSGSTATLKMGESVESPTLQVWITLRGGDSKIGDRLKVEGGESVIFDGIGQWHTVKVVVSNKNDTYRMYIDGKRVVTDTDVRVFDFYKTITTLKRITIDCPKGDMLIDDFKFTVGGPEHAFDPEPPIVETFTYPIIYEQTFDSWKPGTFETKAYPRWITSLKPGMGTQITIEPYQDGNILRFYADEDPLAYATTTYNFKAPLTKDFTVEIRFRQPGDKENPVGGQLSLQPKSGGYGNAGPDLRLVHNSDVYTLNGYNMTMGEAEEDGWHVLAVYVNMTDRTYDVYDNGNLMEEGIPFRNTNTAVFEKLIIGHSAKIGGVTEFDYVRIYDGQHIVYDKQGNKEVVDGFEQLDPQVVDGRDEIPSNYSDVNLSTRNIRSDGYKGHEGSLDILKQFMVTQDRWVYATNPAIVERVTDMGIGVQLSVSPNSVSVNGVDTDAKFYDGTEFAFAWLPAATNSTACLNNPAVFETLLKNLKMAVESGARSIQNDDAMYNYQYYKTGGCFCQHCMTKFADFLLTTYTTEELAEKVPGVVINKSFNYRTYLEKTFGWTTTAQYTNNRSQSPLELDFENFLRLTTINYHTYVNEYLDDLGYGDIAYSANVKSLAWGLGATDKINLYKSLFTGSMPETNVSSLTKENLVSASYLESAMGTEVIWGAIPSGNYLTKLRTAAARSYALGVQVMIPWDTYNGSPERAWCTVDELGDIYHFVRQYPYLFDDYEAPAVVGVVMSMDNMTYADIPGITNPLFNAGIPFKLLPTMSRDEYLKVAFDAEDVEGLEYIWPQSPVTGLSAELQQIVADSGATQTPLYPLLTLKKSLKFAWVENGTDTLYTSVRSYNGEIGAPTSVHVINDRGEAVYNTVVSINRKYLPQGVYDVVLYRPGYDPVVLNQTGSGMNINATVSEEILIDNTEVDLSVNVSCSLESCVSYTVDEMTEWSVLHIVPENASEGVGTFQVSDGWSGLSLGTGLAIGDAISQDNVNAFTLTTGYRGFNVRTETDRTGSQDMMPFVYKNVKFSKAADYCLEGKVSATDNSGIMVREFPASNARFVSLYVENGKLIAAVRTTDNKAVFYREIMDVTEDIYLKILKNGTVFEFYASKDGENWGQMLISVSITLEKPLAGIFAFSSDSQSVSASVTDVALTELGINESLELGELEVTVDEEIYLGDKIKLNVSSTTTSGLTLNTEDFESVVYTSSDPSVLTIDADNYLISMAGGEAVLSITAVVGKHTLTKEMTITVATGGKVYINENFDLWTPETAGANWNLVPAASSTNNTYAFSASFPSDKDRSMGLMDFSIYQPIYTYVLDEEVTRNYSVEFDYYVETELAEDKIANLNTIYLSSSSQYQTCLFYERGYFKFYDNMLWHNIAQVNANQWVHIKIDINYDDQTNTFTITDSSGATATASFGFRNAATGTVSLRFATNTTTKDLTVYYDNLKMYLTGQ